MPLYREEAEAQRVRMASPKAHGELVTELEKQIHEYFSRNRNFGGSSNNEKIDREDRENEKRLSGRKGKEQ